MSDKLSSLGMDITIDENNRIRVLPSDKYAASEKLKGESQKFVESNFRNFKKIEIISFNSQIKQVNELLENHAKKIEKEKLKVRNIIMY